MDREKLDEDLRKLDKYDLEQKTREDETRKNLGDYDRKVKALRNLTGLKGINEDALKNQIDNIESAKQLDEDRLSDYSKVRERYNVEEPIIAEPTESEPSFNNVIRNLDDEINMLDENDPNFDEDYKRLMRRREALIKLNSDRK